MAHINVDNIHAKIWMNGHFVPWNDAHLHVLSHGINNASCVFEGMRAYNSKIFRLEEHMARFFESAELLGFYIPFSLEELINANKELIRSQNIIDGYIRPIAWLGNETLGISAAGAKVNVAIAALPWPNDSLAALRERGVSLALSEWVRPAPNMSPYKAKASCHYVLSRLAHEEAKKQGYEDALFLDYRGYIAESTGSNIFFISQNTLFTPIADCFLNGITRQTIIALARQNNIKVLEKHIHPDEIAGTSEAFLTGTAYEIMPVQRINSLKLKSPGSVTTFMQELYNAEIFR